MHGSPGLKPNCIGEIKLFSFLTLRISLNINFSKLVKMKMDHNFLNFAFHLSCKLDINYLSSSAWTEIGQCLDINKNHALVVYKLYYHKFSTCKYRPDHDRALF